MRLLPIPALLLAAAWHGAAAAAPLPDALHGTIGKLEVYLRLGETPAGALSGHYFYAARGGDLSLGGERHGASVALVEQVDGAETGRFALSLDDGGGLSGTWSSKKRPKGLPVHLAPIPRTPVGPVLVVPRHERREVAVKSEDGAAGRCTADLSWPELFGLPDARVEAALNAELQGAPLACDAPGEHSRSFSVHLDQGGLLSLEREAHGYSEAAAHPYAEVSSLNVVTATGRRLEWKDLLAPGAEEKLLARLEPLVVRAVGATPGTDESAAEVLRGTLTPPGADFFLEEKQLRMNPWGQLPHAFQALAAGTAFTLTWDELRPLLVTSGEASRLWIR